MVLDVHRIWFGVPSVKMQYTPAPRAGLQRSHVGYYEGVTLENGKRKSRRSAQTSSVFNMDFFGNSGDLTGTDVYNKYANGFYGNGLLYFSDYYAGLQNAMSAEWASPYLINQGFSNITSNAPTFAATASNTFNQPPQTATWSITDAVGVFTKKMTIAIPPTHTLYVGASGSKTGTAVVRVRPYNPDGSFASTTDLTLLSATAGPRVNASFAGSSYTAVDIYLTRTTTGASTISITSMMALLYESTATSPAAIVTNHQDGEGHHGLSFSGETTTETYAFFYPPQKGVSIVLEETE